MPGLSSNFRQFRMPETPALRYAWYSLRLARWSWGSNLGRTCHTSSGLVRNRHSHLRSILLATCNFASWLHIMISCVQYGDGKTAGHMAWIRLFVCHTKPAQRAHGDNKSASPCTGLCLVYLLCRKLSLPCSVKSGTVYRQLKLPQSEDAAMTSRMQGSAPSAYPGRNEAASDS